MRRARILKIDEPDFGCEGRPDGVPLMDEVTVRFEDNREEAVLVEEDERLWREQIDEGSVVWITEEGKLEKE